jgi:hypothetical protein
MTSRARFPRLSIWLYQEADCFKFRNKLGLDVALEALRLARQRNRVQNRELFYFARLLRVEGTMTPYLQAVE